MFDDSGNSMQIYNFCSTKRFTSEKLWKPGKWLVCVFKSTITASNFLFLAHLYAELCAADKNDPTPTQTLKSLGLIGLKCCFRRKNSKMFSSGAFHSCAVYEMIFKVPKFRKRPLYKNFVGDTPEDVSKELPRLNKIE